MKVVRTRAKIALCVGIFATISFTGLAITILAPRPTYRFLDGRPLIMSGELPLVEDVPHGTEFRNCWVYSWREDWIGAYDSINNELYFQGFHVRIQHGTASWTRKDGKEVELMNGQVRNKRELEHGPVARAGWVTVGVTEPAPDNWLSHVRLVLSPF